MAPPTTRTATSSYSSLDLTISVQGFSLSPPFQPSSVMRDVDINQVPTTGGGGGDEEEYCCMDDTADHQEDYDDCTNNNGPARKKLRLTKEQSRLLEESFRHNHTLNTKQKEALAMELKLRPRQVEVWFQNRRARSKLKQTEMECEYLKRWFGSLTEQNRRLQREVDELRGLKVVGPSRSVPSSSSSSLTMCPRCERVSSTGSLPDNKSSPPTHLSSYPSTSP